MAHMSTLATSLSGDKPQETDAYWRAATSPSLRPIYQHDNPLLKERVTQDDINLRLLGHGPLRSDVRFLGGPSISKRDA
jgi:phosphoketolase